MVFKCINVSGHMSFFCILKTPHRFVNWQFIITFFSETYVLRYTEKVELEIYLHSHL